MATPLSAIAAVARFGRRAPLPAEADVGGVPAAFPHEELAKILDGRQQVDLQLDTLLEGFQLEWSRQFERLGNH